MHIVPVTLHLNVSCRVVGVDRSFDLLTWKCWGFSHLESILSVFEFFSWRHIWCVCGLLRHHLVKFGVGLRCEFLVFVVLTTVAVSSVGALSW